METLVLNIIIIVLAIAILAILVYLAPKFSKFISDNKIPIEQINDVTEKISELALDGINNSNLSDDQKDVFNVIVKSSSLAVRYAEQLYISGKLEKDARKDAAGEFIENVLTDAGIEVTEERKELIASVIEAAVYLLPKTSEKKEIEA